MVGGLIGRKARDPEAGYNLVALMVVVAVVNIGIAAALPVLSKVIQREKEAELIFRGLQYAEAIRVFQVRTGRFPVRLEELIEVEPRAIRQLWLDPMNEEPEWGLILAQSVQGQNQQGQELTPGSSLGSRNRRNRDRRNSGRNRRGEEEEISPRQRIEEPGGGRRGIPRRGQQVTLGPIIGVHSLSDKEAVGTFDGSSSYKDWKFTVEVLPQFDVGDAASVVPRLHSNWIGRGFPQGLEPDSGDAMPGSALDDDDSRDGRRRGNRRDRRDRRNRRNQRDQSNDR